MESQTHQLAAIMFTDIAGYTALMGEDEQKAFEILKLNRRIQQPIIEKYNGKWLKEMGDGILASFISAYDAVYCAIEIQKACKDYPLLKLHIGIHLGEVVFEGEDVFGDGVNLASRLQAIAPVGSIVISEAVFNNISNKKDIKTKFIKEELLKNVKYPVKIYEVITDEKDFNTSGKINHPDNSRIEKTDQDNHSRRRQILLLVTSTLIFLILVFVIYLKFDNVKKFFNQNGQPEIIDKSIAVLPFVNMSNDPDQEYFSDGMMDEILNHLCKIGELRVISRSSCMKFKGSKLTAGEIADELSVSHILEGSVRKYGDHIRIIVQLIDAKNDQHLLWSENYDRQLTATNIIGIQSDVAQQVAENLKIVIDPDVKERIEVIPTQNMEAYNLYLKTVELSFEQFDVPKELLEKAISLDPAFADAYAALALRWVTRGSHFGNLSRQQVLTNIEPLLNKALQLDRNSVLAHTVTALARLWYDWDFVSVEKEYQELKRLNPSDPDLKNKFSEYLLASGQFTESLNVSLKCFDVDKNSTNNWVQLALAYYFNGQPQKALTTVESASKLLGYDNYLWLNSIRLYVYLNKYDDAIKLYEDSNSSKLYEYSNSYVIGLLSISYHKTGNTEKSAGLLNELLSRSNKSPVGSPSFFAAAVYTAKGEKSKALKFLEKAYADHEVEMYRIKVEPLFTPLREEAEFGDILKKVGFKD
jgi:adenylate cyclase